MGYIYNIDINRKAMYKYEKNNTKQFGSYLYSLYIV